MYVIKKIAFHMIKNENMEYLKKNRIRTNLINI